VWKDYSKRNNERIIERNVRAREMHEKEICNRAIVAKQRVPKDFWFNPYIEKFNGKKFAKGYA
jgi:hypothetical protein